MMSHTLNQSFALNKQGKISPTLSNESFLKVLEHSHIIQELGEMNKIPTTQSFPRELNNVEENRNLKNSL